MLQLETLGLNNVGEGVSKATLSAGPTAACIDCLVLFRVVFVAPPDLKQIAVLIVIAMLLGVVIVLHARFLFQVRAQHRKAVVDLHASERGMSAATKTVSANRALAAAASAEAEALRNTTRTLTLDLQLNGVLRLLLETLAELVPYDCARVLLLEGDSQLLVATESSSKKTSLRSSSPPKTIDISEHQLLARIIQDQKAVLLGDVSAESLWRPLFAHDKHGSWLGVPLVVTNETLGVLCAHAPEVNAFTHSHLRVASSLAISAAAAIQKARLHERAEIYGSELEKRLLDLRHTQIALEQAERQRMISEDKFQAVFRGSPIAFSVTTLKEGVFLEVNPAFEERYGYSRSELIGRTVYELRFWEDPADRTLMTTQLGRGGSIRNLITQLRTKSGELKLSAYSADRIQFDGKTCVLAVTGDVSSTGADLVN